MEKQLSLDIDVKQYLYLVKLISCTNKTLLIYSVSFSLIPKLLKTSKNYTEAR